MGQGNGSLEQEDHYDSRTRPGNRVRCLEPRLGSDLSRDQHGGSLDNAREDVASKLSGTTSSHPSLANILEGQTEVISPTCQGINMGGPWTTQEKTWQVNCLELLAATLALQTFLKDKQKLSVLLKLNNTFAVA